MVHVKVKRNIDDGVHYLKESCKYVLKKPETVSFGGYGVTPYDPDIAYNQMMSVKKYFGKTSGNPLIHIIVSYENSVKTIIGAIDISRLIVMYFCSRYQLLWAVHHKERGCSKYHLHIVINSVSYLDGKMFHSGIQEMNEFAEHVSFCTEARTRVIFATNDEA